MFFQEGFYLLVSSHEVICKFFMGGVCPYDDKKTDTGPRHCLPFIGPVAYTFIFLR